MREKKILSRPELSLLLDKFDAAWADGFPPDISEYVTHLKVPELRREALLELVMIDLERRWRRSVEGRSHVGSANYAATAQQSSSGLPGRPIIEDYLHVYPDVGPIDRIPVDLVICEYQVRCHVGDVFNRLEYEQRFPSLRGQLSAVLRGVEQELDCNGRPGNREQVPGSAVLAWSPHLQPVQGYRLIRRLGKGAMGEVWEAEGPGGMPVAVKRVELGSKCGELELSSLELLKRVRHPHLLSIHAYWLLAHELVIGIELADQCLSSLLKELRQKYEKGMSRVEATNYLTDAAEALDYLSRPIHRVNDQWVRIQHRDIKPANLLIQGGAVKVADFGLAKTLEHVVQSRTISMTPAYAPPEFFRGEAAPSSDQYSLGVTYYELRTGKVPFRGSLHEIMDGHLHQEPQLEGLDEPERRIVARALAKNPELRWASCVKFIGELRRAKSTGRATPTLPGRISSLFNRIKTPFGSQSIPEETATEPTVEETVDLQVPNEMTREFQGQPITTGLLLIDHDLVPLPLKSTEFKVSITVSTAEVTAKQRFRNSFDRAVEATYLFPLPADAAVHRLVMHIGDRIVEGFVRERVEADTIYREAKLEGHGAAILTEEADGIFRVSVANLLAGQDVQIEISYLQPLPCDEGQYRLVLPTVIPHHDALAELKATNGEQSKTVSSPRLPEEILRGDNLSIELDLDAGVPLCNFDSPSHDIETLQEIGPHRVIVKLRNDDEIPNRDFVLKYQISGPGIETALLIEPVDESKNEDGSFLLVATPPRIPSSTIVSREYVILLDCSLNMAGEVFGQASQAARQLLEQLEPTDCFNLIAFANEETPLFNSSVEAVDAKIRQAVGFLETLKPTGLAELQSPLRKACTNPSPIQEPTQRIVVLLSNGYITPLRELPSEIRQCIGQTRLVTLGIGPSVNRDLLDRLSRFGRGFAEYLFPGENVRRAIDRLLRRLREPVLTEVKLTGAKGEVTEVFPEPIPDLFAGRPLVIHGRYRGSELPIVKLTGRSEGKWYDKTIRIDSSVRPLGGVPVRSLWAKRCIDAITDQIWAYPEKEESLRQRIVELALRYHLTSKYTSLVAVEYRSPAEREQARKVVTVEIPQLTPGNRLEFVSNPSLLNPKPGFMTVGPVLGMAPPEPDFPSQQEPSWRTAESRRAKLDRVRKSRVHITYDDPKTGSPPQRTLPFVFGVLADLHGPQVEVEPLSEREFLSLCRDSFSDFMRETGPSFDLRSIQQAILEQDVANSRLIFRTLSDFEPSAVRTQLQAMGANFEHWLDIILQHSEFIRLKATWRGLSYLTGQAETFNGLEFKVLHATKRELADDIALSRPADQSTLYRHIYGSEVGHLSGHPFGVVIADYEVSAAEGDIELLENLAKLGAKSFCPFVVAASPSLLGLHDFLHLRESDDLAAFHQQGISPRWDVLRSTHDSRFLTITLPRMQWGLPYGDNHQPTTVLHLPPGDKNDSALGNAIAPGSLCLISSVYVWGTCLAENFVRYGSFFNLMDEENRAVANWTDCTLIRNDQTKRFGPAESELDTNRQRSLSSAGLVGLINSSEMGQSPRFSQPVTLHRFDTKHGGSVGPAEMQPNLLDGCRLLHQLLELTIRNRRNGMDFDAIEQRLNLWLEEYIAPEVWANSESRSKLGWRNATVRIVSGWEDDRRARLVASFEPPWRVNPPWPSGPVRLEVEIPGTT